MQLTPYLTFSGNCAEAFRFYEKCLGGKIIMMQTHGETPAAQHVPPEWHSKILHVALAVENAMLMGSDGPGDQASEMKGMNVALSLEDVAKGKRIFEQLSEGGTVQMPFGKTFWAAGFGMVVDKFGTPWMVNCGSPA